MAQAALGAQSWHQRQPGLDRSGRIMVAMVVVILVLGACGGGGPSPDIELSPTGGVIISEVVLGDYLVLTNTRDTAVDLAGHWLCNRPAYLELAGVLEPGESVRISGAPLEGLRSGGGELGLYIGDNFNNPAALLDYVTWGEPGPSLTVAAAGGLWPPGDAIDVTGRRLVHTDRDLVGEAAWTVTD